MMTKKEVIKELRSLGFVEASYHVHDYADKYNQFIYKEFNGLLYFYYDSNNVGWCYCYNHAMQKFETRRLSGPFRFVDIMPIADLMVLYK